MITVKAPKAVHGDALAREIQAAGFTGVDVSLSGDTLTIVGTRSDGQPIGESDREKVGQVIAAHVPPAPPTDPVADLMAALGPADTVAKVKAALTTHLPRALGRSR